MSATLEVKGLRTHFLTRAGAVKAVDGVDFSVGKGEIMGLVGESGSGKSITGFSILGLIDPPGRIIEGSIKFNGTEIANASESSLQKLRGNRIAMIFQDPMMTLNPVLRIDTQLIEAITAHEPVDHQTAWERCRDALGLVGIPSPEERLRAYPHQLSGGMRQRVAIARALVTEPSCVMADEPTGNLDVHTAREIQTLMHDLNRSLKTSFLIVTHDLGLASQVDRVVKMEDGHLMSADKANLAAL